MLSCNPSGSLEYKLGKILPHKGGTPSGFILTTERGLLN